MGVSVKRTTACDGAGGVLILPLHISRWDTRSSHRLVNNFAAFLGTLLEAH
jgi:hypothetical protein